MAVHVMQWTQRGKFTITGSHDRETFPSQGLLNTVNWERMLCESLGREELEFKIKIETKKKLISTRQDDLDFFKLSWIIFFPEPWYVTFMLEFPLERFESAILRCHNARVTESSPWINPLHLNISVLTL